MDAQLSMDDVTMQKHFQDISDFAQCLVDLQHVTQQEADDIKDELDKVNHKCLTRESGEATHIWYDQAGP